MVEKIRIQKNAWQTGDSGPHGKGIKGVKWRYPRQKHSDLSPPGRVTPKKVVSLGSGNPEPEMARNIQVFWIWNNKLPRRYGIHVSRCWRFWYTAHTEKENLRLSHCQIPPWSPCFSNTWMMYNYICTHVVRLISIFHVNISPKFSFLHHSWQWIKIHIRSLVQDGCRYTVWYNY